MSESTPSPFGDTSSQKSGMKDSVPDYDLQLSNFHKAFEVELEAVLDGLPLKTASRVLDLACGDGFYTKRLAERMPANGQVVGVDANEAYLQRAREETADRKGGASVQLVTAEFDKLPFSDGEFDVVWCAQSLFSLPDPVLALKHMRRVLRPGGIVAILENDSLHQVSLPWPVGLELELRAAELQAFIEEGKHSSRFYIGRRLPAVIADAGFEPLGMSTQAIDRQAPLAEPERILLQSYLENTAKRIEPHLDRSLFKKLETLIDPGSPDHILKQKYLHLTWINVIAFGKKPQ